MADYKDDIEVEIGAEDEGYEEQITYDEDSLNLVPEFASSEDGRKCLKRIAAKVDEDFTSDWDSSDEYRERQKRDWMIFSGDLPPKDFPFEDAANPSLPIMLENLSRLCFRATGELFGDWTSVFGVLPVGPDDDNIAEILTRHGNWQITEQIPDFKRQIGHRGLLTFFAHGDVVAHSFYDDETRLNRHEVLTCDNFVTPFMHVTTMPDFSDCPHYTKILRMYRHELEAKRGVWHDVDKVLDHSSPSWDDEPDAPLAQAVSQTLGISPEGNGDDKKLGGGSVPYQILWYEGWLRLPNQDRDRWCQVIQDKGTKCILRLTIHERVNWQDRERYDAQIRERDQYIQASQMHAEMMQQRAMAEQAAQMQANMVQDAMDSQNDQIAEAVRAGVADATRATELSNQLIAPPPPPMPPAPPAPMPPMWMQESMVPDETGAMPDVATIEPEPPSREPVYLFAHGVCIEPLVGNLGLSYGRIQADFNRAANTALAQVTDAATMNNCWSIITSGIEFEEGRLNLTPGAINKVTGAVGQMLKDHIIPLQPGQPSPQLRELVEMSINQAQSSIQSPSVLSGEAGKSGETAKGILSRIEQATKQLSVVTGKYRDDVVHQVLRNNAYLNSVFLRDEEIAMVFNSETKRYEELKFGRRLYERNYSVTLKSDLRFTTNVQRVAEADELVANWLKIPILSQNMAFGYAVIKGALDARGRQDLVQLLGAPPPKPMTFVPPPPPMPMGPGMPMAGGARPPQSQVNANQLPGPPMVQ